VTGRPAETFETTARRYSALPEAHRSFRNWLRTFVEFMRTPMSAATSQRNLTVNGVFQCPLRRSSQWTMNAGSWNAARKSTKKKADRSFASQQTFARESA